MSRSDDIRYRPRPGQRPRPASRGGGPSAGPPARSGRSAIPPAARRGAPVQRTPRSRARSILRIVGLVVLLGAIALGVTGCVVYNSIAATLPDPSKPLRGFDQTTQILDRNGTLVTDLFAEQNRKSVSLKDMPLALRQAVIATEDERYYEHPGVDFLGMLRALVVDVRAGDTKQGGSTITQQYVKTTFLTPETTVRRKATEIILAYRMEQRYTKDQILEMYLNAIYFGHGAYGVQSASNVYFGKPVDQVSVAEAAVLAGVIKSPRRYSPYIEPEAAKKRRDTVLDQMQAQGYLDDAAHTAAVATPLATVGLKKGSKIAPYFVEYLKELLVTQYGEQMVYRGGLRVVTTLDLGMQAAAERAVAGALNKPTDPSAALVALDPKTGQIVAMVGGRDFLAQQYNVAVQGHRQSGSAFKPFVLVTALQEGVSPEQTYESGPIKIPLPGGQTWSVTGASGGGKGLMRLRAATAQSVNSVFAQLVMQVGANEVVKTAASMGITTKITPVPAVALGGMREGVSPLEMASAFGTLANAGTQTRPYGILEVRNGAGKVLASATPTSKKAISPAIAYLTTDLLRGVISSGTGKKAAIGRPAAGKTGTTQDYSDAWFVGYTPDLVAAVWVGHPSSMKPMTNVHGIKVTGGSFPAQIWAAFMKEALAKTPKNDFTRPAGLSDATICLDSGGLATAFCPRKGTGLFLSDALPKPCALHAVPTAITIPNLVGMLKQDAIAALEKLLLKYAVQEREVSGVPAGTVADQDPKPGSQGTTSTVVTIVVSSGAPGDKKPVPQFTFSPATPAANAAIAFDAGASTDDGTIVKYVWEFGDGGKDVTSGKIASHKYGSPGKYDVTLWVTDDGGHTASVTHQVTVK